MSLDHALNPAPEVHHGPLHMAPECIDHSALWAGQNTGYKLSKINNNRTIQPIKNTKDNIAKQPDNRSSIKLANFQLKMATLWTVCRMLQVFHRSAVATCNLALSSDNLYTITIQ